MVRKAFNAFLEFLYNFLNNPKGTISIYAFCALLNIFGMIDFNWFSWACFGWCLGLLAQEIRILDFKKREKIVNLIIKIDQNKKSAVE